MQKKFFMIVMLIVAVVDVSTITTVIVSASSLERQVLHSEDVGYVHVPESDVEIVEGMPEEMETETETEPEIEETEMEPEYDDSINSSFQELNNEMIAGDYVYQDLTGDLYFSFDVAGTFAGFFDDTHPDATDYTYELTTESENTVLNIYNNDKTAMVSYYPIFKKDTKEMTLIYKGDESLKLHLVSVEAVSEQNTDKETEHEEDATETDEKTDEDARKGEEAER